MSSIHESIRGEQWDHLRRSYRREDLTIAAERIFYSGQYRFSQAVKVMSQIGVIEERKFSVCLASNMYLENMQ